MRAWKAATDAIAPPAVAFGLRAAMAGETARTRERVDLAWTGPRTGTNLLPRTDQALLSVIRGAKESLFIVTFAAYRVEAIRREVAAAAARGVAVSLVVETDDGPDGRIDFAALAALVDSASAVRVYEWPVEVRPRSNGRHGTLHAKCAIADGDTMFVSSANLTEHAMEINLELGVVVRGGDAPGAVARHFTALMAAGVLRAR